MKSLATIPRPPRTWSVLRLKFCLKPGQEGSKIGPFGSELRLGDLEDQGIPVFGQANVMSRDYSFGKRFLNEQRFNELKQYAVKPDDVLITMMGSAGRCDVVPEDSRLGIIDSHLLRLRLRQTLDPLYLRWFIDQTKSAAAQAELAARGSIMAGLNSAVVRDLWCPLPPLATQRAIVSWLKVKTAAIDALIEKKRRLVQLLAEKRAALINCAVTKGLDPTVPMKDSGIPWIGEIPAHWNRSKLGFLSRIGNGSTPERSNRQFWTEGTVPWLNSGKVNDGIVRSAEQFVTLEAVNRCHLPFAPVGSVIMGITGEGQTRGRVALLELKTTLSQHLAYISLASDRLLSPYLWRMLTAFYEWLRWSSSGGGSTKAAITCTQLRDVPVLIPPVAEQANILIELNDRLAKIDRLKSSVETQMLRLQEYRQALITAAVTGQLEIPVDESTPEEAQT